MQRQQDKSPADHLLKAPTISLPKGGGAIRGIGEKFAANPVTGTCQLTIPIATSPGRSDFGPQLALAYDSGAGNGPFGFGWSLSLPSITRKTDKGLPRYRDTEESDLFLLSGAEDLVPVLIESGATWEREVVPPRVVNKKSYRIQRYRPRIEGLFARIERWTNQDDAADTFWRSISKENITTWYGKSSNSRIVDPEDSARIFSWLICETHNDKGGVIYYEYNEEDSSGIALSEAHERNRTVTTRSANRYPKSIKYGNRTPYYPVLEENQPPTSLSSDWLFEAVFDYGGHDQDAPVPLASAPWPCRNDPFSSYRAGFEVRTYRLCQRVLMFHHFPGESGVGANCLVRSTDFTYSYEDNPTSARNPVLSFLDSVTQVGYKRSSSGYLKKAGPPTEFEYSQPEVQEQVHDVDLGSMENLPYGLADGRYQWVDLDGEGLSGILTEQAGAWFYKRNLSPVTTREQNGESIAVARFGTLEQVALKPSLADLASGQQQFLDLAGDGQLDLVQLRGPTPGFYERTPDEGWESFTPFESLPRLNWGDRNLKFIDLTGDGRADILVSEDEAFTWYPSLGESGFAVGERVRQALDEEKGPRLLFADATESIYLSDMSGDGLNDIARIRNGEVCYWPNLGYGRFGPKVMMDNSPWFDLPDLFDQRRVHLADIDGSGVTDIIYLKADGVHLYFNQSGNSWSQSQRLTAFPQIDDLSAVAAMDLLGNGTACLVWSSKLPGDAHRSMRYVDLMGGQKPHLLIRSANNLGAETITHYAPSTKFYLADKLAGQAWVTKIPFPVHVVERAETYDYISKTRFVTRYAYHHGYFDGVEREFRGFGMVEQWDTEFTAALSASGELPSDNLDATSHVPPVQTKTWFHTGVYLGRDHVSDFFAGMLDGHDRGEYYREPAWRDDDVEARKRLLGDTVLPDELTTDEEREACRALKGVMLRQEIYALDGTDKAEHPYTVTEQNFSIEVVQPCGENRHAVFFTHAREAINYHYERTPSDPRVAHTLTLKVDQYGNVLRSVTVTYPRADVPERQPEQDQTHLTLLLNRFANRDDQQDWRHIGLPVEARAYEVVKPPTAPLRLTWIQLRDLFEFLIPLNQVEPAPAKTIPYEQWDWRKLWNPQTEPGGPLNTRLRIIEHDRTLYRPNDLGIAAADPLALLSLGTVESLALTGERYKLAFTPGLLAALYQRPLDVAQPSGSPPSENLLPSPANVLGGPGAERGGYVDLDSNGQWWIPSGRVFLSPVSADTSSQELTHARLHFFLPHRYRDPFHTGAVSAESLVIYDAYDLLMSETSDALGNRVTVGERDVDDHLIIQGNDYRVLQPRLIMDPNRNRSATAFDAFGLVVGTAVMGKPLPAAAQGDSFDGFDADLTETTILEHLAHPLTDPGSILRHATTRLIYDQHAYYRTKHQANPQAAVVYTMARETHDSDPIPADGLKIQHTFSYSDGFGREIQKKLQAEAGPVPERDGAGKIIVGADGQPLMTTTDISPRWVGNGWTVFNNKGKPVRQYEPFFTDTHLFEFDVRIGVSPVLFYDPTERLVATLRPNHTWEKVVFSPWRQETWDASDNVLADPHTDQDVKDFFGRLPDADYLPTWHAQRQSGAVAEEQDAASKAAVHAGTPSVAHADTLGRSFLMVAHNKFKFSDTPVADPPVEEFYSTRVIFDIEGNQREVVDTKNRVIARYNYDMLGNRVHQSSMEAGERWTLSDVAGKPLYIWDSRDHRLRTVYDPLRRPTDIWLREGASDEALVGRTVYGETEANPENHNLRVKVFKLLDQAGVVTTDDYDFKGNLLRSQRQLAQSYSTTLDWSATVPLETDAFVSSTRYDALNRPTELTDPDNSVINPSYNEANLLERIRVNLRGEQLDGEPVWTDFVTDIDYDAKGQRTLIVYGNGVRTAYTYDPLTFRVIHLLTWRDALAFPDDCPQPPPADWPGCQVQSLYYTYDPSGNITHMRDDAQQKLYFRNKRVEPSADYMYDAIYRLIEATGRERLGQVGDTPTPASYNDKPRIGILLSASDGKAVGRYLQRYLYDGVGNFQKMIHRGSDPVSPGWTRAYAYNEPSLLEPANQSNRLSSTTIGATTETYSASGDGYDPHGNMLRMPQLQAIEWNFQERMRMTRRQAVNADDDEGTAHDGERTWYVYDAGGQRVRKVTEAAAGAVKEERIYIGGFELYRRQGVNAVVRETLHIMDDKQRIALVETRTAGAETGVPAQMIRYQFGNHLGSSSLELDEHAQLISYEEYTPYGSTSYQAVRSQTETPKRYRYIGMERDQESGLQYHSARYYIPWLGRWSSTDPKGIKDEINLYQYVSGNPIRLVDVDGASGWERFLGGVKAVGGAFETAAGVALVGVGVATSEIGIGIPIAAAGVLVTAHGADTVVSGVRTAARGEAVDSFTSQGLQAAGMSRTAANLTDAGISVVGTLGAGALTRAPGVAAAAADAAAAEATPAVARALPAVTRAAPAVARAAPAVARAAPAVARAAPAVVRAAPAVARAAPVAARAAPAAAEVASTAARAATEGGAALSGGAANEMITIFRGTEHVAELNALAETGHVMSDAARVAYMEARYAGASIESAMKIAQGASETAHASQLASWGSLSDYVQAHGAFGSEFTRAFGLRSMISFTTDVAEATRFAGPTGTIISVTVPRALVIPQTLAGAGESEVLIVHMLKVAAGVF